MKGKRKLVHNDLKNCLWEKLFVNYMVNRGDLKELTQQAIGYQKEIKKTLGKTSETDAYLKFEMTSYVKCQTDL